MPNLNELIVNFRLKEIENLIFNTRDYSEINMVDSNGMRPMQLVAQNGLSSLVLRLMNAGADIDLSTPAGLNLENTAKPPLYLAAELGHIFVAEIFLACGANIKKAIEISAKFSQVPVRKVLESLTLDLNLLQAILLWVVMFGRPKTLQKILEKNAYDEKKTFIHGLIELAMQQSNISMAKILLKHSNDTLRHDPLIPTAKYWAFRSTENIDTICRTDEDWIISLQQLQNDSYDRFIRCYKYVSQINRDKFNNNPKIEVEDDLTGEVKLIYTGAKKGRSDFIKLCQVVNNQIETFEYEKFFTALSYAHTRTDLVALVVMMKAVNFKMFPSSIATEVTMDVLRTILIYSNTEILHYTLRLKSLKISTPINYLNRFENQMGLINSLVSRGAQSNIASTASVFSFIQVLLRNNPDIRDLLVNSIISNLNNLYKTSLQYTVDMVLGRIVVNILNYNELDIPIISKLDECFPRFSMDTNVKHEKTKWEKLMARIISTVIAHQGTNDRAAFAAISRRFNAIYRMDGNEMKILEIEREKIYQEEKTLLLTRQNWFTFLKLIDGMVTQQNLLFREVHRNSYKRVIWFFVLLVMLATLAATSYLGHLDKENNDSSSPEFIGTVVALFISSLGSIISLCGMLRSGLQFLEERKILDMCLRGIPTHYFPDDIREAARNCHGTAGDIILLNSKKLSVIQKETSETFEIHEKKWILFINSFESIVHLKPGDISSVESPNHFYKPESNEVDIVIESSNSDDEKTSPQRAYAKISGYCPAWFRRAPATQRHLLDSEQNQIEISERGVSSALQF